VLGAEVERFLTTVRTDAKERRRFVRFGLNGIAARLLVAGGGRPIEATVTDLSEGGAAVRCGEPVPVGTELSFELAVAGLSVPATAVRTAGDGVTGIQFPADETVRMRVRQALRQELWSGSPKSDARSAAG
jgi:hypothetical protein